MNTTTLNLPTFSLDLTHVLMPYVKESNELKQKVKELEEELKNKGKCSFGSCKNMAYLCAYCVTQNKQCKEPYCANEAYRCCSCTKTILDKHEHSIKKEVKSHISMLFEDYESSDEESD